MQMAANYCLVNNINLEEALGWADRSINTYFGEKNFLTLSTYAGLLEKTGNKLKADSLMKKAYPLASMVQLNSYGRSLLVQNKTQQAYDVYKMNYDKYPDEIYARIGMIRACAAVGKSEEALKYADKALALAKDSNTKTSIEKIVAEVKSGKKIIL